MFSTWKSNKSLLIHWGKPDSLLLERHKTLAIFNSLLPLGLYSHAHSDPAAGHTPVKGILALSCLHKPLTSCTSLLLPWINQCSCPPSRCSHAMSLACQLKDNFIFSLQAWKHSRFYTSQHKRKGIITFNLHKLLFISHFLATQI